MIKKSEVVLFAVALALIVGISLYASTLIENTFIVLVLGLFLSIAFCLGFWNDIKK